MSTTEQSRPETGHGPTPHFPAGDDRRLRRIMFASQKGGVGKTASAVNVAALLGQAGKRVLLLDTDPNGSVAACFGIRTAADFPGVFGIDTLPIETLCVPNAAPNVDVLPYAGDRRAQDLDALEAALAKLSSLADAAYDFLIVDSRPSAQEMTRRLCRVVDEVVVVFQCQPLAFRTLRGILTELKVAKSDGATGRLLGLLLTMVDVADPDSVQLEAQIRSSLGKALLPMSIPFDPLVSDAFGERAPVVLAQPAAPASTAYRAVTQRLLSPTSSGQPR